MEVGFLDDLGLGPAVAMPFANTARFRGQRYLTDGLALTGGSRCVLQPIPNNEYDNWDAIAGDSEGSSEGEEVLSPESFDYFHGVSASFGPGGQDSDQFQYRVNDKEPATDPPLKRMRLLTPTGEILTVTPRAWPRTRVTEACVKLAISEWMERQFHLPITAPNRHEVQWDYMEFTVDNVRRRVAVWLWRGLEQIPEMENTWRIVLD